MFLPDFNLNSLKYSLFPDIWGSLNLEATLGSSLNLTSIIWRLSYIRLIPSPIHSNPDLIVFFTMEPLS